MLSTKRSYPHPSLLIAVTLLIFSSLILVACSPEQESPPPAAPVPETGQEARLIVPDQHIESAGVVVSDVIIREPGWIVIAADQNGSPGDVIGYQQIDAGRTQEVVVLINTLQATETLHAVLHVDAGQPGVFEYPGPDQPLQVNGEPVSAVFTVGGVTAGMPLIPESPEQPVIIEITGSQFEPAELTIAPGTIVLWNNISGLPHTVTSDQALFDSGRLENGENFEFVFREAGAYTYYCQFHGGPARQGMSGVIVVTEP
jgi:plastocyanin